MSKPKTAAPEQPQHGGSYQREKDGTLTRVEGPDLPSIPPEAEPEHVSSEGATAPNSDSQEG